MSPTADPTPGSLRGLLVLASVGLAVAVALRLWPASALPRAPVEVSDEGLREGAVDRLVADSTGIWDSASDPDVVRLLQPSMPAREYKGAEVRSNRFGLRERDYALPKPEGTLRVVLLGDSFVFGPRLAAELRLGHPLERLLSEALPPGTPVECLHLGISSWNLRAECAFLRRQLSLLQPDLVVHLSVRNDLDDTYPARGFGTMARGSLRPEQAGIALHSSWPRVELGLADVNHLAAGLDARSRARFAEGRALVEELAAEVERQGGRYLHVAHWDAFNSVAARRLLAGLEPEQQAFVPLSFVFDKTNWVTANDSHWGELGNLRIARALFGLVLERGLVPDLTPDEQAAYSAAEATTLFTRGAAEAEREPDLAGLFAARPPGPAVVPAELDDGMGQQVYAGLWREGRVAPFLSVVLFGRGERVRVEGRALDRPELDGLRLVLAVEGRDVAEATLTSGEAFVLEADVPDFDGQPGLIEVQVRADDWALESDDLRRRTSWILERAERL